MSTPSTVAPTTPEMVRGARRDARMFGDAFRQQRQAVVRRERAVGGFARFDQRLEAIVLNDEMRQFVRDMRVGAGRHDRREQTARAVERRRLVHHRADECGRA
ncbi:hypothetical protein [Candidatus Burkholderia verschuerenii]|uniref:hypothetical protein n=1 Tax=Candidatus Burkholderia verschuerenii TaxID=242163 RepID=UPI001E2ED76C|nr:hypothetical protein [Candidatus Burkholderia verschuerenii]